MLIYSQDGKCQHLAVAEIVFVVVAVVVEEEEGVVAVAANGIEVSIRWFLFI